MKLVKQIAAIIFMMVFLISSSGFLVYKSYCACTGNEKVSMFVNREVCDSQEDKNKEEEMTMSCCSSKEAIECKSHATDCDCDKPEVTYFKLKNQVLNEELKFTTIQPIQLFIVQSTIQDGFGDDIESDVFETSYIDPPPLIISSLSFLIKIQQLKIPNIA